ncbi:MAG: fumarylacetoacetate hydrolase family protein [Bacteroidales bacterium]|nr:fumarylacetoacetate hydrolase family protein [Bacteroidales bacterium]
MKIICLANNYREHAKEINHPIPENPIFFLKPDTALLRNNQPFFLPDFSDEIHYEVELVIKISRLGKGIAEKFASRYFSSIGIGIDFTARDIQRQCVQKGLPWEIAKAFDNSAVISPRFLPIEQFTDLSNIQFRLDINGKTVQEGNSGDMIFSIERAISHISKYMTLRTGDLLFMGTPPGVGPVKIGDRLQAFLENQLLLDFLIK